MPGHEGPAGSVFPDRERLYVATYRFQRCSVIQQTYVPEHRDVVITLCSLRNMNRFRSLYRKKYYPEKINRKLNCYVIYAKKYEKGLKNGLI